MKPKRYESMQQRIILNTVLAEHVSPLATPCWIWMGTRGGPGGHGRIQVMTGNGKKTAKPHRVAFEAFTGKKLRKGQVVRHKCDNPLCCNPDHLETGSVRQNNRDTVKRGRHCNQHTKKATTP